MNIKNILLGILVLALASVLIGNASATVTWSSIPIVVMDEDTSFSVDLFDYVDLTNANGTIVISVDDTNVNSKNINVAFSSGILTVTPTANWNGDGGTINIIVDDDDTTPDSEDISIFVNPVNDAPVFTAGEWDFSAAEIKETVLFSYDVNATDADAGDVLTYTVAGLPTSLTMAPTTGIISGTPVDGDEGVYTATLTVTDDSGVPGLTATKTVKFQIKDKDDDGKLTITDVNFDDLTGDEDRHYPGDIIEIEVEVTNELSDDNMEDVTVSIKCDSLDIDEEIDINEIDSDDYITETIQIQIPYDAEDKAHDFEITVRGRDDSDDRNYHSGRYFEPSSSLEDKTLSVRRSNHDIIVAELTIDPDEAESGDIVIVTATVANIGEKDEDNVEVTIKNTDLGINKVSDDFSLNDGKTKKLTFEITIPEDAETKTYALEAIVSYDNDADDEDDTPLSKSIDLDVAGGITIVTTGAEATLKATAASLSASRGSSVKYELTLTNEADETMTYELRIAGVNDWATYSIEAGGETNEVSLPAGQSLVIYVYLTPRADATLGQHTATVSAYSGTELIASEILTADVTAGSAITGAGITFRPSDSATNWAIFGTVIGLMVAVLAITIYKIKFE